MRGIRPLRWLQGHRRSIACALVAVAAVVKLPSVDATRSSRFTCNLWQANP